MIDTVLDAVMPFFLLLMVVLVIVMIVGLIAGAPHMAREHDRLLQQCMSDDKPEYECRALLKTRRCR
jgi:hypothetical protein